MIETLQPHTECFDRLDTFIADGRLLRGAWSKQIDGREHACLIAALWADCGDRGSSSPCPSDLLPPWLANLAPWVDDAPSCNAWPHLMRRTADAFRRLHVLDAASLRRCEYRHLAFCVREAAKYTGDEQVIAACETVCALCDRVVAGDKSTFLEWVEAEKKALAEWSTREPASLAAVVVAGRSARSADSVGMRSVHAARGAAVASALSASRVCGMAVACMAPACAEVADRIVTALLDSIEMEIGASA